MKKKILLSLVAMAMLTTGAMAAEDTVDYGDSTYVYGGDAVETTDTNENGRLDGLLLRAVEEATYYTAGDGFLYFTPATEEEAAIIIMDNATLVADYGIQAVTDVDLILVGENLIETNVDTGLFCFNVVEGYDSNLEALADEDIDYGVLTIYGEGSLALVCGGSVGFQVGQFVLHSGDISIDLVNAVELSAGIAAYGDYASDNNTGFYMDGGSLTIDMGENAGWGMYISSADFTITDGTLNISGGATDSVGVIDLACTKDVNISVTGGETVIENNGTASFGNGKLSGDVSVSTLIDFSDDAEGVFVLSGMFNFGDVMEVHGETGTVAISIFDGVAVESNPQLIVTGMDDYLYSLNEFSSYDFSLDILTAYSASFVGNPSITDALRATMVFPFTTTSNAALDFTFTRAQVLALLWDSMGCPEATMDNPFTDVSPEDAYYEAILWAVEAGITTGTTATTFDGDALCTKGQLLTFLYRNAGQPAVEGENVFADVNETSYMYDAVLWGIVNDMMDVNAENFDANSTVLKDGAIAYLICMYE